MHCLVFEVNSIQSFIFATGRLRDAIGGSELIDLLTNADAQDNLLDNVLRASESKDRIEFSRRAGGAFYAFSADGAALERFGALWMLAFQQWAPGLGFVLGRGQGQNMPEAFHRALAHSRSQFSCERPLHPVAAPVAERAARTGRVAVGRSRKDGSIDAATQRQKQFADLSRAGFIERYSPQEAELGWRDWPRNLEPDAEDAEGGFPFPQGLRDVALIRADGNGMGKVLIRLGETVKKRPDDFLKIYQTFSKAIDASTCAAAQRATREVLMPMRRNGELLAARPILLGGDDVIVLVRADLALAYVQSFARAFEQESERQLEALSHLGVDGLPQRLTVGFGIAFIGASQPFSMASHLATSIMEHAKTQAKRTLDANEAIAPSSVAFHRVTTALADDYDRAVKNVMTHRDGSHCYTHTLGTYAVLDDTTGRLPRLADLNAFVALLQGEGMARGPLRALLSLLQLDPAQARASWRRWRQLMHDTRRDLEDFDACMARLMPGYDPKAELPYVRIPGDSGEQEKVHLSPLGDALDLLSLQTMPLQAIAQRESAIV